MPAFPRTRMRRTRRTDWLRRLVREHRVAVDDLIWPVFVHEHATAPIASMPGVVRHSLVDLADAARAAADLGIPAVAVFPVVERVHKTPDGEHAFDGGNLVCRAVREAPVGSARGEARAEARGQPGSASRGQPHPRPKLR